MPVVGNQGLKTTLHKLGASGPRPFYAYVQLGPLGIVYQPNMSLLRVGAFESSPAKEGKNSHKDLSDLGALALAFCRPRLDAAIFKQRVYSMRWHVAATANRRP